MASPSEKLAKSLERLGEFQGTDGVAAIRSRDLTRTDRERLLKNGFIQEVMKGWYIPSSPEGEIPDEFHACLGRIPLDGYPRQPTGAIYARPRTRQCRDGHRTFYEVRGEAGRESARRKRAGVTLTDPTPR